MAAEAADRDDATAGPADCTEMEERVRCFRIILDALFAKTFGIETVPSAAGLSSP